jgi:hypothetical protein
VRQAAFGLGFFLAIACGGESNGPTSGTGSAAASGEDAGGGSGHRGGGTNTGGRTNRGGTAGTSAGGAGGTSFGGTSFGGTSSGGTSSGGTSSGGSSPGGGSTATGGSSDGGEAADNGEAGSGGTSGTSAAGSGGQVGGGAGRDPTSAECDPADGELKTTPYPDCEPRDASDDCELCIQAECCAESKVCYGYAPGNVCGWGGPSAGAYAGLNEIDCYVACVRDYAAMNGVYDDVGDTLCVPACTTPECGLIGNATQDLVVCMRSRCEAPCFVP